MIWTVTSIQIGNHQARAPNQQFINEFNFRFPRLPLVEVVDLGRLPFPEFFHDTGLGELQCLGGWLLLGDQTCGLESSLGSQEVDVVVVGLSGGELLGKKQNHQKSFQFVVVGFLKARFWLVLG